MSFPLLLAARWQLNAASLSSEYNQESFPNIHAGRPVGPDCGCRPAGPPDLPRTLSAEGSGGDDRPCVDTLSYSPGEGWTRSGLCTQFSVIIESILGAGVLQLMVSNQRLV
jgi:hypothetical protein